VLVLAAACVVLAGCAQPGYDARRIQRQLRDAGLTAEQARCVTEGLETEFEPRLLASHSDPTPEDLARTREVLARCRVSVTPPP
jgi:hypothetical protein